MKKVYLFPLMLLSGCVVMNAQTKIDLALASKVGELRLNAETQSRSRAQADEEQLTVYVTFADATTAQEYAAANEAVRDCRGNMVIATLSIAEIESLSEQANVLNISGSEGLELKLDAARAATGVDAIHNGEGLQQAYTGKGVVAGIFDTGVDPNHVNFSDGDVNRIKSFWTITGNTSAVTTYDTPDKIARVETDNANQTHGTHVLGIMAGGFKGATRVAYLSNRGINTISNRRAVPYYGVATGAELAVCAGTLESANTTIAAGLVADYAKKVGKPAVLNMSLGSNLGPHDGSSAQNRYLEELGKDMIICVSSGNEASTNISYSKSFTSSDKSFKTCLSSNASLSSATIDVWSSDAEPLTITISGYNKTTGAEPMKLTFAQNQGGKYIMYGGSALSHYSDVVYNADLNNVFGENASVRVTTSVDGYNNRYRAYIVVSFGNGVNSRDIVPVISVEGKAGKTVNMYTIGTTFMSNGLAGFVDGNDSCTISDMACGKNVISVGAYTNRSEFATFIGKYEYKAPVGQISYFSSYGKTFDGRQLPHVVGPGEGMISSFSYYYIKNQNLDNPETYGLSVNHTHGKRASYWAEMSGTSMSSPYVAGVVALWLEADPTLTYEKVLEVMKATCDNDAYTAAAPERWGYGKINALAGIKYILNTGAVSDVATDSRVLVNQTSNGVFEIFSAAGASIDAKLYSLSGVLSASINANSSELTLDASNVVPGVYVLRVQTGNAVETQKVVIR